MHSYTLLGVLAFAYPALARYELKWDYNANNFWENFNFIDVSHSSYCSDTKLTSLSSLLTLPSHQALPSTWVRMKRLHLASPE